MRLRKCYALIFVVLIGILFLVDLNFVRQSQIYLQSFNQEIPAGQREKFIIIKSSAVVLISKAQRAKCWKREKCDLQHHTGKILPRFLA